MEGMKLMKMFCAFMSRFATATVMCCIALSQCLSAATLPFDVTVLQGDATASLLTSQKGTEHREVMFLVIDHSGSMTRIDGRVNSRWDALLDSLRSTLKSVRVGTEVRVEWIESRVEKRRRGYVRLPNRPAIGPIILTDESSWKSIWSQVEEIGAPPKEYGTPLFETLENVSRAADDLVQRGTRVAVVVFSDGDSNEYMYESQKKKRREQLNKDFAGLFANKARFKTCLVWINPKEAPPDELMGAKWNLGYQAPPAVYSTIAEPMTVAVENPLSGGQKPGALSFAFFVPPDVWKKMEGKPAQLSVMRRGEKGDEVPVELTTLSIRRGVQTCRIEVPDKFLVAPARTSLSLQLSKIPSPEGALVSPPPSVSLLIVEPNKLTVSPIVPSQGAVFRKGEKIKFSVSATPDASCSWSFDDGTPTEGGLDVYHSYAQAGSYEVKVVVRKDGFAPREGLVETRKIEVVHADVILEPIAKQVQGRESKFSCKGTGPVSGYVWIVDGEEVFGIDSADKKSSTLLYSFQSAGPHTIQVRAKMNRIGSVLSEKKSFDVGVAPYLRIDKPDAGTAFVAGEQIPFHAKVDGGVSNVKWSIADSSGAEVWSVPDVADGGESKSVATLDKPGEYTARVVDVSGLAAKSEVVFSVRPKDVSLVISDPADGSRVETGVNKTIDLRVSAKGIEKVLWFVRNDETGAETALGESQVDDKGYASKAWPVPPVNGMGTRIVFARDAASDFESASVRVELYTVGTVKIIAPPDYFRVPFGTNVVLKAEVSGEAKDVKWFVDGEEMQARGEQVSFATGRANSPERLFRVQARASMPGGGTLVTPERTVVAYCPKVRLAVKTQPSKQGSETSYGLNEKIGFSLVSLNGGVVGHLSDIEWNMGDGTILKGQERFDYSYTNYYTAGVKVSVSCKCSLCGDPADVKPYNLKVEEQPPKAVLEILEKGSRFGTGDTINLCATNSTGDIVAFVWEVNGEEIAKGRGQEKIAYKLPSKPCDMVFTLKAVGPDGDVSEDQRGIRVRNGLLGIGLIALSVLVIVVLALLLLNNGSAGWKVKMYCCAAIDHSTNDGITQELGMISDVTALPADTIWGLKYWGFLSKKLTLPFEKVLSDESLRKFLDQNTEDFMLGCKDEGITVDPNPDSGKDSIYSSSDSLRLEPYKPDDEMGMREQLREKKLYTIDYRQFCDSNDDQKDLHVFRFIVDRSKEAYRYAKYFVVLTFCVIVAAVWAALKCAI